MWVTHFFSTSDFPDREQTEMKKKLASISRWYLTRNLRKSARAIKMRKK